MTETWLQDRDSDDIWKDMTDLNKNLYKLYTLNRKGRSGGGVTIITQSKLNVYMLDEDQHTAFQYAIWKVSSIETTITIIIIYHPTYSNQHPVTNAVFLNDITEKQSNILPKYNNIILAADVNLHVKDDLDTDASAFIKTIEAMGLQQLIYSPTHRSGNILDLIFTEITEIANIRNGHFYQITAQWTLMYYHGKNANNTICNI